MVEKFLKTRRISFRDVLASEIRGQPCVVTELNPPSSCDGDCHHSLSDFLGSVASFNWRLVGAASPPTYTYIYIYICIYVSFWVVFKCTFGANLCSVSFRCYPSHLVVRSHLRNGSRLDCSKGQPISGHLLLVCVFCRNHCSVVQWLPFSRFCLVAAPLKWSSQKRVPFRCLGPSLSPQGPVRPGLCWTPPGRWSVHKARYPFLAAPLLVCAALPWPAVLWSWLGWRALLLLCLCCHAVA